MFQFIISGVLFFCSQIAGAETFRSFPDNDLWKEDPLYQMEQQLEQQMEQIRVFPGKAILKDYFKIRSVGDEKIFNRIIDIAGAVYKSAADNSGETLVIHKNWTDPTVNAS